MPNLFDLLRGEGPAVLLLKNLALTTDLAGSAILSALQENGLGIRKQTFYQALNYYRGQVQPGRSYVANLPLGVKPTPGRLAPTETNRPYNYYYSIVGTGLDENGEETPPINYTVVSNRLLSKQQAIDVATRNIEANPQKYGVAEWNLQVTDIKQNKGGVA